MLIMFPKHISRCFFEVPGQHLGNWANTMYELFICFSALLHLHGSLCWRRSFVKVQLRYWQHPIKSPQKNVDTQQMIFSAIFSVAHVSCAFEDF